MKAKFLSVSIAAALITACGGDSGSSSSGSNITVSNDLKGPAAAPAITEGTAQEGDLLSLNTRINSTVDGESIVRFDFMPEQSGSIVVKLDTSSKDLDLEVQSSNFKSADYSSDLWAVHQVEQGEPVRIYVDSYSGKTESFSLTIVEANRETLGLNDNEFIYSVDYTAKQVCVVGNGSPDEYSYSGVDQAIVNFKDGYIKSAGGSKLKFASSTDTSFTVKNSTGSDFSVTIEYNIDTAEGTLTTKLNSNQYFPEDDERCEDEEVGTGKIVL